MASPAPDLILAGGGLANGLVALALARLRPEISVMVIEAGERFGGNHVWSFFTPDIDPDDRWLVEPLRAACWPAYDVRFPAHRRTLATSYNSCLSERLDRALRAVLPAERLLSGRAIREVRATRVVMEDGAVIEAGAVIDGRGPGDLARLDLGWQKFVGVELATDTPHGIDLPVVMDATVPQLDGYRFVYLLPFAADRLLIEDTYYSNGPELDVAAIEGRIDTYVASTGLPRGRIVRRESGVLPVVMGGDFDSYWRSGGEGIAKIGARAGLFHPTTGYSLPDAVRTARLVAGAGKMSAGALHDLLHDHARRLWRERGFYRMLDTMLFRAAAPPSRYRILERFYRLDRGLIDRFYAGRSTLADKLRILAGRPPVPLGRALRVLMGRRS